MPTEDTPKVVSSENLAEFKLKCDETYLAKSALPSPSAADDGKVLGVVNGQYALVSPGSATVSTEQNAAGGTTYSITT